MCAWQRYTDLMDALIGICSATATPGLARTTRSSANYHDLQGRRASLAGTGATGRQNKP
jgi:hypothetical protein